MLTYTQVRCAQDKIRDLMDAVTKLETLPDRCPLAPECTALERLILQEEIQQLCEEITRALMQQQSHNEASV